MYRSREGKAVNAVISYVSHSVERIWKHIMGPRTIEGQREITPLIGNPVRAVCLEQQKPPQQMSTYKLIPKRVGSFVT